MILCSDCNKIYFSYVICKQVIATLQYTRTEMADENVVDTYESLRQSEYRPEFGDINYYCPIGDYHKTIRYEAIYSDWYDIPGIPHEASKVKRDTFVLEIFPYLQSLRKGNCIDLAKLSVADGFKLREILNEYYEIR